MMHEAIKLEEKYERQGWPSLDRPDLTPPEGWSLSLVTAVNRVRHHALSPDGQSIAFVWDREELSDIFVLALDGGWPARISTERAPTPFWSDEPPCWSPDGEWLAFSMGDHVYVAPVRGGMPRRITGFADNASQPAWMPDGHSLVVAVERDDLLHLYLTDRDGGWPRRLTDGPGDDGDPQPSPEGKWLAYVHVPSDDLNRQDIRLIDLESGRMHLLAGAPKEKNWNPRWSPDGQQVAFLSQRSGWDEVWVAQPDGLAARQVTHLSHDVADIAWSPDGTRLACTINRGGAFDLALVEVDGGAVAYLRTGLGIHSRPRWSPRGDFLTVEYEDSCLPPDLYRIDVPSARWTQLTFSNLPALAGLSMVVPERITYRSEDGLEIPGFLYRPPRPNMAAVVAPHGGPVAQAAFEWDPMAQYLIAKGYTYLCPNYRGGSGYGVAFEHANYGSWGIGDTQDCLAAARYIAKLDGIDSQRLAIYGPSYGGYMTICCLSRDPDYLYACGITKYGDSDLLTSWAQCKRDLRLYTEMPLGHPAANRQAYINGSPIYQVENVRRPVLILHGLDDDVVPPEASEQWVEALRAAGKTFEYKTYAGEPHGFTKRRTLMDAYRRVERFLDWYLLPR